MLRSIKDMENFAIRATDGTIGHVMDFLFDDERVGHPLPRRGHRHAGFRAGRC